MANVGLILTLEKGVRLIKFNRPHRKNALYEPMYKKIQEVLDADAQDNNAVATIITGNGDAFSSGNDLKAAFEAAPGPGASEALGAVEGMIRAFIEYPKLIIAVVNGLAVGIGATILGLCDVVYASDRATFSTPFVKLGLCAEAASSITFPLTMGRSKASEMLLLGETITAQEAYDFGLIARVIPHEKLEDFIQDLRKYGQLPLTGVRINKKLLTESMRDVLLERNRVEIKQVGDCVQSEEFINRMIQFVNKKSKL